MHGNLLVGGPCTNGERINSLKKILTTYIVKGPLMTTLKKKYTSEIYSIYLLLRKVENACYIFHKLKKYMFFLMLVGYGSWSMIKSIRTELLGGGKKVV